METRRPTLVDPVGRSAWIGPLLVALTGGLAYRMLWPRAGGLDVEGMLFRPGELPVLAVLGLSAWLLTRRRGRWRRLASEPSLPLALALAALGAGLFVWALLTRKVDLLLPSLAANGLALAAALRGVPGCRAMLLPALVLLLGVSLPRPLEDEIVWRLQVATARGAGALLVGLGREVAQSGVILRDADHTFHVIDACSGLNGIAILTGIALVVRELFARAGARIWALVALAPVLGLALNVLRVAYVAASPDPEALAGVEGDHTLQGLAVVMAGTALLYALGSGLARGQEAQAGAGARGHAVEAGVSARGHPAEAGVSARGHPAEAGASARGPASGPSAPAAATRSWLGAAIGLAGLAGLSFALPPFAEARRDVRLPAIEWPMEKAGWTGEPAPHDPLFTGVFPSSLHRRYAQTSGPQRTPEIVDVLVGLLAPGEPASTRLSSSKLLVPGPEWSLVERSRGRLWMLDREVEQALAVRRPGGEHAVVYAWHPRGRGLWRESWRALLALDASPFRRARPPAVVRLMAYAPHDGQLVLDRAHQRLDRFVSVFREELDAL